MKALIFSDIHGDKSALKKIVDQEADYYFAAGDLTNFGRGLDQLGEIMKPRAERMFVMPGNHESARENEQFCERFGFHNFHAESMRAGSFFIAGLGYSNVTPFQTPGEYSEAELSEKLSAFAPLSPLILICHCPPKDSKLDRAGEGQHFGSPAVREFIGRYQPAYFFCGHIHEAAGASDPIGQTQAFNVGKRGYMLEFD